MKRQAWFILRGLKVDCCYKYFDGSGTFEGMAMELFSGSVFFPFLLFFCELNFSVVFIIGITTSITGIEFIHPTSPVS